MNSSKKAAKWNGAQAVDPMANPSIEKTRTFLKLNREIAKRLGKYTVNRSGTVDASEVDLSGLGIDRLPVPFGKVKGGFLCGGNRLSSLAGAPQEVGGDFDCSSNRLTSLKGAPRKVGGGFRCEGNRLKTLEGAPRRFSAVFSCDCSSFMKTGRSHWKGDHLKRTRKK